MDTDGASKPITNHTAVWAITPGGIQLGARLCRDLLPATLYLPNESASACQDKNPGISVKPYAKLSEEIRLQYRLYPYHIFIFATGIAVRILAPLLKSKTNDPAVVVMDETGKFSISLVSGHLGGANTLAKRTAAIVGATPVITTATDSNDLPSIDMVAKSKNLVIETPENIKRINMKLLKGVPFTLVDPAGIIEAELPEESIDRTNDTATSDLFCSHTLAPVSRETLVLRPKILCLGIGCNRNTPAEEIVALIKTVFHHHGLSLLSIKEIGSSKVKEDEAGLIEAAHMMGCPLVFYPNEDLNSVETVENPSTMAQKHLGVKSVCEAAAILGAQKGPLIVPKQKTRNVTLALALSL